MKTLFITATIWATAIAAAAAATAIAVAAQKPYSAPRTPWGPPDLQGTWTTDDARSVPLQRAPEFGERRLLSDQEYADRKRRDDETRGDVRLAAGTFVGEVGTRTHRQTSLVIEPGNGRVPASAVLLVNPLVSITSTSPSHLPVE